MYYTYTVQINNFLFSKWLKLQKVLKYYKMNEIISLI